MSVSKLRPCGSSQHSTQLLTVPPRSVVSCELTERASKILKLHSGQQHELTASWQENCLRDLSPFHEGVNVGPHSQQANLWVSSCSAKSRSHYKMEVAALTSERGLYGAGLGHNIHRATSGLTNASETT